MVDVVVTEAKRPLRIGAKTERRGSLLCRIDCIYKAIGSIGRSYELYL